jgi:hypothetical protein
MKTRICPPCSGASALNIAAGLLGALLAALVSGCGGGKADFSLVVSPPAIQALVGGASPQFTVTALARNGFKGTVSATISGLPAGVTASPTTFPLTGGSVQQVNLAVASSAHPGTTVLTVTGASGALQHTAAESLTVNTAASQPDFTLTATPASLALSAGGAAGQLIVSASAVNGFSGPVAVTLSGLPAGLQATPSTLSLTPGSTKAINIAASPQALEGRATITLTGASSGASGSLSHSALAFVTVSSAIAPTANASLSASIYDFGNDLVNNARTEPVVTVTNTGAGILYLNPVVSGSPDFFAAPGGSCGAQLAPGASCDILATYNPVTASVPAAQSALLNLDFTNVPAGAPQTMQLSGISSAMPLGQVTGTNNPQVALYTMTLPFPGSMTVNFGTTTSYGQTTWTQSAQTAGGQVSIYVAGMLASTAYHMQATVNFTNGVTAHDVDHTFTTGAVPSWMVPTLTAGASSGMTPQPGLEMLDAVLGNPSGLLVTDLTGNVLWTYADPDNGARIVIDGVKMLPNGDLLMVIGPISSAALGGPPPPPSYNLIREVTLAGDTVRQISIATLNKELASATCNECNVTLQNFHHDVTPLPNGHWLVLSNTLMGLSSTTTPALTNEPAQVVLGDVVVDLDQNLQPVWAWNEFNHLNPNRHPMNFPDWTHSNAVLYSPDDGNILVSIRHQNWIVKVNYANGTGAGNILWYLGYQGTFTLKNGVSPTDWQYAQHGPSFFSTNTTGVFSLGVMDNGDDRVFPTGVTCGSAGAPPCLYSTVPVWQIDESAKTATLTFHQILPPGLYNSYGGNAEGMANGDVEYDLCEVGSGTPESYVFEVTPDSTPQTVWEMHITQTNLYRAFRIPGFYPGGPPWP